MENAKEQQERHIRDLSGQIQRYVNEVKRVEELLAHRETERSELLQQYKSLSVEIDTSETLNRSLEAKVGDHLRLDQISYNKSNNNNKRAFRLRWSQ
jgi:hypothetical protein